MISEDNEVLRFEVVSTSGKAAKAWAAKHCGEILRMEKVGGLHGYDQLTIRTALLTKYSAEDVERIIQLLTLCGVFD